MANLCEAQSQNYAKFQFNKAEHPYMPHTYSRIFTLGQDYVPISERLKIGVKL